jgi:sulfane dehydrogenase subunit SoxC
MEGFMANTSKGKLSRRALLAVTAGAVGARLLSAQDGGTKDPTKVQGDLARELGERSRFEEPRRTFFSFTRQASNTPLQHLDGIITPSDLHYERHHAGIPDIDPDSYSLLIHGMVERPRTFTLADLKRFPTVAMTRFLECSGNGFRTYRNPEASREETPQQVEGLTSTSEWFGVRSRRSSKKSVSFPGPSGFSPKGWTPRS